MSIILDGCRVAPGIRVEPAACIEPLYGLESVVGTPEKITDAHMENGVEWEPADCVMAEAYCNSCTYPGDAKVYHGQGDLKKALPFAVYGSFKCSGPGYTPDEIIARARQNLERGQWRRIEREFWTGVVGNEPHLDDSSTTDLTPGAGAMSIIGGLAALEGFLGEFVPCQGVLHVPRGVAMSIAGAGLLPTVLEPQMRTHLGTLIAAGGGYNNIGPDGDPAPAGEAWLYATGTVRMWWGDILAVPGAADKASVVTRSTNDLQAVAERTILIGYECDAAAVRVEIG